MDRVFFYVLWSVSPKLLFVIFVVVITLFFPHYAEAGALSKATSLTTGLIGCWDFDGPNVTSTTVTDCSGNGRKCPVSNTYDK